MERTGPVDIGAVAEQRFRTVYGANIDHMVTICCRNPCVLQQSFWRIFSVGYCPDDAASDLVAGIAGRLAGKIIGHVMNHYRTSQDGVYQETFVIKDLIGVTLITEKGRKISRMSGMGHVAGIVVISGLIKRSGAVSVFVDVHAVEITGSLYMDIGKPEDFGFHKNPAVRGPVKFHGACKLRI